MSVWNRIAKAVTAELTPMLSALVKAAVDEANVDLKADVAALRASVGNDIKGDVGAVTNGIGGVLAKIESLPAKLGAIIGQIPGVGPIEQLLKGLGG